jgi:hypothetical protein
MQHGPWLAWMHALGWRRGWQTSRHMQRLTGQRLTGWSAHTRVNWARKRASEDLH